MGLSVLFAVIGWYVVYLVLYLSDVYNVYVFDRVTQNMQQFLANSELLEFDYIIIGAGTAGSLLATKMLDKNVLLLEAGTSLNVVPELPIFGPIWQSSMYDWNYVTEPQSRACKAMNEQRSRWPRGKVFGGSHLLSNLINLPGEPEEYRQYLDPNEPFDYERDIGQYLRDYESLMDIQEVPFTTEFSRQLKLAGSETEYDGFRHPNVSVRNGFRHTTAALYRHTMSASLDRAGANHTVLFNAMVNRLLLCPESSHVNGVEFSKGGEVFVAKARKAVILSAGAIGSPAILLRSGIGPRKDLEALGIETRVDLPVGRHLQDHIATGIDLVTLNSSVGVGMMDILSAQNLYKFLWDEEGLISHPGCDLIGLFKVLDESQFNDLQFMIIPFAVNSDNGVHLRRLLNFREEVYYDYFHKQEEGRQSVTILAEVVTPKSEGFLKLRSQDPEDPPIMDPKYLSHPYDLKVLLKGIKIIKKLLNTETMKNFGAKMKDIPFPGCEHLPFDTDPYWVCYIEHVTLTSYHVGGTCRMGSCPEDSVVDHHFRVHGVENLYIVDASVMPQLPAANPIATITMLALRFVDREIH